MTELQEKVNKIKELVQQAGISEESQLLLIQQFLSALRTDIGCLERKLIEAEMRQNVYAEVSEKILNRVIDRTF